MPPSPTLLLSAINYYDYTAEITATEIQRYRHVNEQWLSPRRRVLFPRTLCVTSKEDEARVRQEIWIIIGLH